MNKDIKRYLLYTFTSTWLLWGLLVMLTQLNLIKHGAPLFMVIFILGGIMPAICEIWLKKKYSTKEDFKAFINNITNPKHSIAWYIIVAGLGFLFCFLPTLWGGATMKQPLYIAILEFPVMIIGGGLEEIGWRGFLQPELQKKLPSFISTLIVGVIWSAWHLPLWFMPGSNQASMNFLWFLISALALSFLLAEIYSATKSIFLCIIFHALINSFWDVFVADTEVLSACFTLMFSIIIFIAFECIRKRSRKENGFMQFR